MIKFNSKNLKTLRKHLDNCLKSSNVEVSINRVHIGEVTSFEIYHFEMDKSELEKDYYEFVAYKGISSIAEVWFDEKDEINIECIEGNRDERIGLIIINFEAIT